MRGRFSPHSGDGCHNLAQLELVQDRRLSGSIKADLQVAPLSPGLGFCTLRLGLGFAVLRYWVLRDELETLAGWLMIAWVWEDGDKNALREFLP